MRVTGGTLRGRQVKLPPGIIRPAMDMMRESVFAVLGDLYELSFLDLFAGSGLVALEAASRGSPYIEAVEKDARKREILLDNVSISPVRIQCRFQSVELYVERSHSHNHHFDIIFCDPPFNYKWKEELLNNISSSPLMSNKSTLILHHPVKEELNPVNLMLADKREYGISSVCFFKLKE